MGNQPANPNNKKQYVRFLQGDTQQGGGAGDKEVPGGQGGGRQLGLPQAEDCRHLPGAQEERACSQLGRRGWRRGCGDIGRGAPGCLDRLDWPRLQAQGEAGGQSRGWRQLWNGKECPGSLGRRLRWLRRSSGCTSPQVSCLPGLRPVCNLCGSRSPCAPQDDQAACSWQESCPKVPSCKTGQPYSGRSKHPGACQSLWWQALGKRMPRDETCHAGNQEPSQAS